MFTQHPIESEFFNVDDFVKENIEALCGMYYDAVDACHESNENINDDELVEQVSVLMAVSIVANKNVITIPVCYNEDHKEVIIDLAQNLHSLVMLLSLESRGLLKRSGDKFSLTDDGKEYNAALNTY